MWDWLINLFKRKKLEDKIVEVLVKKMSQGVVIAGEDFKEGEGGIDIAPKDEIHLNSLSVTLNGVKQYFEKDYDITYRERDNCLQVTFKKEWKKGEYASVHWIYK